MTISRRDRRSSVPEIREEMKLREELKREALQTAAYCRLSVLNGEEDSIDTQVEITHSYIEENPELVLAETYIDNGFTGTNFDRPGWNALIQDVQEGRISCIVVKDLSRLGRNHVETQHLIETIFPMLNVRFISITDNFDSDEDDINDGFLVPTKNIMNSLYARDISRKIRSSFANMKREGRLCTGIVPYGYTCHDKSMVIVPEEARMVRMIFKWAKLGVRAEDIAARLNLMGEVKPNGHPWNGEHIRHILKNPVYIGTYITGKISCSMKKKKRLPEDAWYVYEEHHEAIIRKEDFEAVNDPAANGPSELKSADKNGQKGWKPRRRTEEANADRRLLAGIVYCSVCGKQMWHKEGNLYCQRHTGKRANEDKVGKVPGIPVRELRDRLLRRCRRYRDELEDARAVVNRAAYRGGVLDNITVEATAALAEKKKVEEWGESLFIQMNRKEISEEAFRNARRKYHLRLAEKQEALSEILKRQRKARTAISRVKELIRATDKIERIKPENIRTFVERVDVLPSGYTKIRLKCYDVVRDLLKGTKG